MCCDVILTSKMFADMTKDSNGMHKVHSNTSIAEGCMMLTIELE